jgi:ribosomal protein S18 acetylase RimI-like enzyme
MKIRDFKDADTSQLVKLIAEFRVALAKLKHINKDPNLEKAREELEYYLEKSFPIFVAIKDDETLIGYSVCRIQDDVVWNESLYVVPPQRRKGIASSLYRRSEKLAEEYGNETLYNWVHPNNDASISFLKKQGYNVLNLIEVRKKRSNDNLTTNIEVDSHKFRY